MEPHDGQSQPSSGGFFSTFMRRQFPVFRPQVEAPREREPIPVSTLAQMSDNVYDRPDRQTEIGGFKLQTPEQLRKSGIDPDALHTPSGMHADVYRDDHGRSVVSFRGTDNPSAKVVEREFSGFNNPDDFLDDFYRSQRGKEYALEVTGVKQSFQDWKTNAMQGLGLETQQHNDAVSLAKQCEAAFGKEKLAFTGHSKGGGEAELASVVTGAPAMTFNAAGIHDDTLRRYGLDPERAHPWASKYITSVVTKGEVVNDTLQGREFNLRFETPDGPQSHTIRTPVPLGSRIDLVPDDSLGSVARHLMRPGVLPYLDQVKTLGVDVPMQSHDARTGPAMFGFGSTPMFPMHGRFDQTWRQLLQEPPLHASSSLASRLGTGVQVGESQPMLSKPAHPGHAMYEQALTGVQELGHSGRDAARIAGALTVSAQKAGLDGIDRVVASRDGSRVFAMQGDPASDSALHPNVTVAEARNKPLRESSQESMALFRQEQAPSRVDGPHKEGPHLS